MLPLALASTVARMPVGMGAVALILYVHGATGSFSAAGIVAAAFTIGLGLTGPLLARLIDRRGSGLVIGPGAILAAAALVAVVLIGHSGAGTAAMAVAAAIAGGSTPPVGGVLRQRLPNLVDEARQPDRLRDRLDPDRGRVHHRPGARGAADGDRRRRHRPRRRRRPRRARQPLVRGDRRRRARPRGRVGASVAGREPSPPRRCATSCSPGSRSAAPSAPSTSPSPPSAPSTEARRSAGLSPRRWRSARRSGGSPTAPVLTSSDRRPAPSSCSARLQALTCLPILLVASIPAMFLAAALAGICVAPLITVRSQLTGLGKLAGTGTEAFTWLSLAITVGASAGSALAGPLVEAAAGTPGPSSPARCRRRRPARAGRTRRADRRTAGGRSPPDRDPMIAFAAAVI